MNKKTAIFAVAMVLSAALCSCGDNNTSSEDIKDSQQSVTEEYNDSQISEEMTSDSIENESSEDSEDKNKVLRGADNFVDKEELTLETPLKIADFVYLGESISDLETLINSTYGKTFKEINMNIKQATILTESGEVFTISANRRDGVWTLSFMPNVSYGQVESTAPCTWEFAGFDQDVKRKEFWPVCDKHEEEKGYYITSDEEKPSYSYIYASSTLFGASPDEDAPVLSEPIQEVRICYYSVEE